MEGLPLPRAVGGGNDSRIRMELPGIVKPTDIRYLCRHKYRKKFPKPGHRPYQLSFPHPTIKSIHQAIRFLDLLL